ncbi:MULTISPECIES: hypothetical protein [Tolypothrix]
MNTVDAVRLGVGDGGLGVGECVGAIAFIHGLLIDSLSRDKP